MYAYWSALALPQTVPTSFGVGQVRTLVVVTAPAPSATAAFSGSVALTIITPSGRKDTVSAPVTIAPSGTTTVTLSYTPTLPGTYQGTVSLLDSTGAAVYHVAVPPLVVSGAPSPLGGTALPLLALLAAAAAVAVVSK